MKTFFLFLAVLLLGTAALPAQAQEIVIEMHGKADPVRTSVSIWNKDALELTRLFRKKDRTHVLYQVSSVSSHDGILQAANGQKYAYVRYGSDDGDYRKFLFKANDPQTFVVCAANIADVLAVNKKFKVNLGVHRADFLRTYESKTTLLPVKDETSGKEYLAYKMDYSDINHKVPTPHYFVFENDMLLETFDNNEAFYNFVNQVSPAAQPAAPPQNKSTANARQTRPARKALVSGGTASDRAYMPRAVNAKPLPALTPSKTPAGTPLP